MSIDLSKGVESQGGEVAGFGPFHLSPAARRLDRDSRGGWRARARRAARAREACRKGRAIYAKFSEGRQPPDLQAAQRLLDGRTAP